MIRMIFTYPVFLFLEKFHPMHFLSFVDYDNSYHSSNKDMDNHELD